MSLLVRWPVVLILVGSCGPKLVVPAEAQGPELLIIENRHTSALCSLTLTLQGTAWSRRWLEGKLKPGARVEARVKPGTYEAYGEGCENDFVAGDKLTITGPTALGIGGQPDTIDGRASVMVTVNRRSAYRGGVRSPGPAAATAEERSCTGMCGGPEGQFGSCCPDEGWHCVIDPKDRSDPSATGVCSLQ